MARKNRRSRAKGIYLFIEIFGTGVKNAILEFMYTYYLNDHTFVDAC